MDSESDAVVHTIGGGAKAVWMVANVVAHTVGGGAKAVWTVAVD
jgi:hypothetical protein